MTSADSIFLEPDFIAYCLKKLTPQQFCTYLACRAIGNVKTSQAEIAKLRDLTATNGSVIHHHLKNLQQKGFLLYSEMPKVGTQFLWIRENKNQDVPLMHEIQPEPHITMISPNKELHPLRMGEVAKFCREHGLIRVEIYKVLNGKKKQHHGWTATKNIKEQPPCN